LPETTVTAIVLRRTESGENDRRLVLLTRELGKIEAIAKGARKSGSRLAGSTEPLTVAELHLAEGRVRRYVTQAQPVSSLRAVRSDYDRLMAGLAMAELASEHLPFEVASREVFDRLLQALSALSGEREPAVPLVWFAARLLREEGHMPDWSVCAVSGRKLQGSKVDYAPSVGGAVSTAAADSIIDARSTSRDALLGITKIAELDEPPARLKLAKAASAVLFYMWQGILDRGLPAWEAVVQGDNHLGE
jgi:DNA repair protein RecO (recombination protein O)